MINKKKIVIAYLYNSNGMAAWNVEVATALHDDGHEVWLVHSSKVVFNTPLPFPTISFDIPQNKKFLGFFRYHIKRLVNKRNGFAYKLDQFLREISIFPDTYLFNQSNLIDIRVKVPQYIKASTYPSKLSTYIGSVFLSVDFHKVGIKQIMNHFIEVVGWYFTDWYAYKHASGVLCHTQNLADELKQSGIRAFAVPPPIVVKQNRNDFEIKEKIIFLTVVLDVEDKRKRIKWIIDNFLESNAEGELHVAGKANELFVSQYEHVKNKVKFLGLVPRNKMQEIYKKSDVFLFASTSDTWGYVLAEAMSNGLIVIAPDLYPYDYILGDRKFLFPVTDETIFKEKIMMVTHSPHLLASKQYFSNRAKAEFSHEEFVKKIALITA